MVLDSAGAVCSSAVEGVAGGVDRDHQREVLHPPAGRSPPGRARETRRLNSCGCIGRSVRPRRPSLRSKPRRTASLLPRPPSNGSPFRSCRAARTRRSAGANRHPSDRWWWDRRCRSPALAERDRGRRNRVSAHSARPGVAPPGRAGRPAGGAQRPGRSR